MKNLMKGIVLFVPAIGAILFGPVLTMTMFLEKLGVFYVYGVIDGLLVALGILWSYTVYMTIFPDQNVDG